MFVGEELESSAQVRSAANAACRPTQPPSAEARPDRSFRRAPSFALSLPISSSTATWGNAPGQGVGDRAQADSATPLGRFFKKSEIKKLYDIGDTLGSGNFAVVKKAKYKNAAKDPKIPEEVAIKIIDKAKVEDMNDIQAIPAQLPSALRRKCNIIRRAPTAASACPRACPRARPECHRHSPPGAA